MLGLDDLSEKLNQAIIAAGSPTPSGGNAGEDLFKATGGTVLTWLQTRVFSSIIAVVIFITVLFTFYGSFLYFTAYGDENKATQAKKTVTYAIVGFIIAVTALGIASTVQRMVISKTAEEQYSAPISPTGSVSATTGAPATGGFWDGDSNSF